MIICSQTKCNINYQLITEFQNMCTFKNYDEWKHVFLVPRKIAVLILGQSLWDMHSEADTL